MSLPVVGIVGFSDSGKTRVASALIERLSARGYRVAAIKHAAHGHQVDRPETDSHRLYHAGAEQVTVTSPGQTTTVTRSEGDTQLDALLGGLDPGFDIVIVEGFKFSTLPKVLVQSDEAISPLPENIIAVVGDGDGLPGMPSFTFEETDGLAERVLSQLVTSQEQSADVSLLVNGKSVPLSAFPRDAISGILFGYLTSLKGVPDDPRQIHITVDVGPRPHKAVD